MPLGIGKGDGEERGAHCENGTENGSAAGLGDGAYLGDYFLLFFNIILHFSIKKCAPSSAQGSRQAGWEAKVTPKADKTK